MISVITPTLVYDELYREPVTHVPSPMRGTAEDIEDAFDSQGAYTITEEVKRLCQLGNNIKNSQSIGLLICKDCF